MANFREKLPNGAYLGRHEYSVDAQHRLALPKQWRPKTEEENRFYLLPGRRGMLQLFPEAIFLPLLESLTETALGNEDDDLTLDTIGEKMDLVSCDKMGRIRIPQSHMDHSGIERNVIMVGAITRIHIWKPENRTSTSIGAETLLDRIEEYQKNGANKKTGDKE